MLRVITVLAVAASSLISTSAFAEKLWSLTGFSAPESVLFDGKAKRIIVSNINGHPMKADGNGFLSLISPEGKMVKKEWAKGLDAPKGMALVGRELIVADLTNVRVIDADSGKLLKTLPAAGAKFLNDVTSSGDSAWISDMMTHTIWHYGKGKISVWKQDVALNHPNGLLAEGNKLIVATWGKEMQANFSTKAPGGLLSIDLKSKAITPIAKAGGLGNLDGVVRLGGKLVVNDWISGEVWTVKDGEAPKSLYKRSSGLADISGQGNVLYMPFMNEGVLEAHRLK